MLLNPLSIIVASTAALLVFVCPKEVKAQEYFGTFHGDLIVKALGDGRLLELTHPFSFTDAKGKLWPVPVGTKVDGASIPQPLWTIVGGPFEDKYREASVIHDHYCDEKTESWENVHLVFYNGMRAKGVGSIQAKLMYGAVYAFGPRWVKGTSSDTKKLISGQPILLEGAKTEILKFISENDPSIEAINELSEKLARTETIEQLERILYENAKCTPILNSENGAVAPNKTLVLCGLSAASKKQAAIKNVRALVTNLHQLYRAQRYYFLPLIDEYVDTQDPVKWEEVKTWSRNVTGLIKVGMRSVLEVEEFEKQENRPPVDEVFELLSERAVMISVILSGPPKSKDEMSAWAGQYRPLVERLGNKLSALEKHLSTSTQ